MNRTLLTVSGRLSPQARQHTRPDVQLQYIIKILFGAVFDASDIQRNINAILSRFYIFALDDIPIQFTYVVCACMFIYDGRAKMKCFDDGILLCFFFRQTTI